MPAEPKPTAANWSAGVTPRFFEEILACHSRRRGVRKAHPRLFSFGPRRPGHPIEGRCVRGATRASFVHV